MFVYRENKDFKIQRRRRQQERERDYDVKMPNFAFYGEHK